MNRRLPPATPVLTESILLDRPGILAGVLSCDPRHRDFHDLGPVSNNVVAFPLSPILLAPIDGPKFVGAPGSAVTMHRAQRVLREEVHPAGDLCFWIGLDDAAALEIAIVAGNRRAAGSDLRFESFGVDVPPHSYLEARRLQRALETESLEPQHAEEQLLRLVLGVYRLGSRSPDRARSRERRLRPADLALVTEVRRLVLSQPEKPISVGGLAAACGVSIFRLSRSFRKVTGGTLTGFALKTRILLSTSHLEGDQTLSSLALQFGFASHSHFTRWFGRVLGLTPSQYRGRARSARRVR